ncbi:MAG: STAS domain-containing protein [bacterium]|nr:STAS domain-containing protein [Candidatus Kapabacteria bacterium]
MRYTVDRSDKAATVKLHEDRLDASNSGDLKGELLILCSSGIEVLFMDLSEVNYCDSTGLSALLLAHREMKNAGGYAILVALTDKVCSLIEIAQLDRVLYIYKSREEAVADLEGGEADDEAR